MDFLTLLLCFSLSCGLSFCPGSLEFMTAGVSWGREGPTPGPGGFSLNTLFSVFHILWLHVMPGAWFDVEFVVSFGDHKEVSDCVASLVFSHPEVKHSPKKFFSVG